jgi:hypothetical protein
MMTFWAAMGAVDRKRVSGTHWTKETDLPMAYFTLDLRL